MISSQFLSRGLAALAISAAVAGCQSKDAAGTMGMDAAAPQKISAEELRAYCPRVTLREGTAYFNTYAKGGQDDASKLVHQASITDVTRSCTYGPATMTINVAVAGRVVIGPAGQAGSMTMPIRVAVLQGDQVLYSQLHNYQLQVINGTTQFVFNDPNVTIPNSGERNIQVFAGFDEGPPAKKPGTSAN